MTLAADAGGDALTALRSSYVRLQAARALPIAVALWVFSGGFVLSDPAPYEILFLLVLLVGGVGGWTLQRGTLPLLALFVAFVPFALVAAFQVRFITVSDALLYSAVTIFLFFTAYFLASYVTEAPRARMRLIIKAYIASAVICSLAGTLGYLGMIPGADLFTRYGRAKGFFQDPNVFAPYLILPAMYLLQRILLGRTRQGVWAGALFMVLLIGVFASFSRAAWGSLAAAAIIVFAAIFFLEAHARQKVRMLVLALCGALAIVVALAGMLSIPSVQRLFDVRASAQTYDEGETGRFGRQGYAFQLALEHPLGLGPLEFRNLHVKEEPHNTYVTVLHSYGWGGGLVIYVFVAMTLWRGLAALARPSPNRLLLIPLMATWVPFVIEAAIIDVDHWREFYLLGGLVWGVTAGYTRSEPDGGRPLAGMI